MSACVRCDRPLAAGECIGHKDGCECATCVAVCWSEYGTICEPKDWRADALAARATVDALRAELDEARADLARVRAEAERMRASASALHLEVQESHFTIASMTIGGECPCNWCRGTAPELAALRAPAATAPPGEGGAR